MQVVFIRITDASIREDGAVKEGDTPCSSCSFHSNRLAYMKLIQWLLRSSLP